MGHLSDDGPGAQAAEADIDEDKDQAVIETTRGDPDDQHDLGQRLTNEMEALVALLGGGEGGPDFAGGLERRGCCDGRAHHWRAKDLRKGRKFGRPGQAGGPRPPGRKEAAR